MRAVCYYPIDFMITFFAKDFRDKLKEQKLTWSVSFLKFCQNSIHSKLKTEEVGFLLGMNLDVLHTLRLSRLRQEEGFTPIPQELVLAFDYEKIIVIIEDAFEKKRARLLSQEKKLLLLESVEDKSKENHQRKNRQKHR